MKRKLLLWAVGFSILAMVSCGSFNYAGAAAAYDGYTTIGYKSFVSEGEAQAKSKGYT